MTRDIPKNGYSEEKHRAIRSTIAEAGDLSALVSNEIRVMARPRNAQNAISIGWLVNQLGGGNNLALRVDMLSCANADKIRLIGEQHESFEDTLPSS